MQQGRSGSQIPSATAPAADATPSTTSRRALREAAKPAARRRTVGLHRWGPRSVVLAALAAATIAVPLVGTASTRDTGGDAATAAAVAAPVGPSAYEVLASDVQQTTPTSLLAAVPGAVRVSDTASRSFERGPLPGCDGLAREASANGRIPSSDLCELWDPNEMLRGDAAVALSEVNLAFRAAFGRDLCITDSYRSLSEQQRLAYTKPGLSASPGKSNHGWGLAIDLCSSETRSRVVMAWISENGPIYGWDNPTWARRGGSGPYEPWHWEYLPGTTELGTAY